MDERLDMMSEEEVKAYEKLIQILTEDWVETNKQMLKVYMDNDNDKYGCIGIPADESYLSDPYCDTDEYDIEEDE